MPSLKLPLESAGKSCVKIFSSTLARDREVMGEQITRWLNQEPKKYVSDYVVKQSSDNEFHCITIVFFYQEEEHS